MIKVTLRFTVSCDSGECYKKKVFPAKSKKEAGGILRRAGWSKDRRGRVYCKDHLDKNPDRKVTNEEAAEE